jgi:hypothetical protein
MRRRLLLPLFRVAHQEFIAAPVDPPFQVDGIAIPEIFHLCDAICLAGDFAFRILQFSVFTALGHCHLIHLNSIS